MGSEAKHTQGRVQWDGDDLWHFGASYQDESDPHEFTGVRLVERLRDSPRAKANAARLAACWNACEGLADPEALRRERDEAVEVLQLIARVHADNHETWNGDVLAAWIASRARDFLAKARGGLSAAEDGGECQTCEGYGWVCERHTDTPWYGVTTDHADCCEGPDSSPGVPCPACKPHLANRGL